MHTDSDLVRGSNRLPAGSDWTFDLIETYYEAIRETAQRYAIASARTSRRRSSPHGASTPPETVRLRSCRRTRICASAPILTRYSIPSRWSEFAQYWR